MKNLIAKLFTSFIMPDYEAYKRAAILNTSATEIALKRDLELYKERAKKAETKVKVLTDSTTIITQKASQLEAEQISPFVTETLTEIENAQHWLSKIK